MITIDKHAIDDLIENNSKLFVFFVVVVVAPFIEELIFRAPLTLFKKTLIFKVAFYVSAILFGYVHIFNFEILTSNLFFLPFLVFPQLFLGMYLGFIRIKFGLIWSIFLHSSYNFILSLMFLLS